MTDAEPADEGRTEANDPAGVAERESLAERGPLAEERVPLAEERVLIDKREVERDVATVRLRTDERQVPVNETLRRERVDIERVPMDLIVETPPQPRDEGDVTVIPIVEEVLVRRFHLIEEVRLRKRVESVEVEETVTLRRQEAHIEEGPSGPSREGPTDPDRDA